MSTISTNTGLFNTRLNSPLNLSDLCCNIEYCSIEQLKEIICRVSDNSNQFVISAKKLIKKNSKTSKI